MLEQKNDWALTRRYMTLETVAHTCVDRTIDVAQIAVF
jgi:putative transposase